VFHDQIGDGDGLGDGLVGNPAIPFSSDFYPGQAALELIENDPYHNARASERWLAAADFRVGHDVAAEFDATGLSIRLRLHASAMDYAAANAGLQDDVQLGTGRRCIQELSVRGSAAFRPLQRE